jgi:hypothetical protein
VNNELDSTVTAFTHDPDTGIMTTLDTLTTLPAGFPSRTPRRTSRSHRTESFSTSQTAGTTASPSSASTNERDV